MITLRSQRVVLALVLLTVMGVAGAQIKKGKSQPMETKYWMQGVMKPSSGALKEGLASRPGDDEAWEQLAMHAALLNESSYILMADGRCPDSVWSKASQDSLRKGSADLMAAIEVRNYDAAKSAFRTAAGSCKGCHETHKPKKKE